MSGRVGNYLRQNVLGLVAIFDRVLRRLLDRVGARALEDAAGGQVLTLHDLAGGGAVTIADTAPFVLSAPWTPDDGDTLTLARVSAGFWVEVARSAN